MAKFQIKLLTQNNISATTHGQIQFLETTIGEFNSNSPSVFSYTYNEKFSIHKNAQKELSFSMIDYYWNDDKYEKNPFINEVSIGSQILLIDTYGNEYVFTVKSISYSFKKSNIEYNYSCQDSFSYQLTRQNSGYTIENSSESANFIGAQTVDWWAQNYIFPDCYIAYKYIPLTVGLYEDSNGNLLTYTKNQPINNVKRIIKKPYVETDAEDKALFERFCFSVSDSNALSSLISLADQIGLSINTREHAIKVNGERTTNYALFCWFDPQYSNETTNLRYSPFSDVQSFSLSQSGNSITTILNVESNMLNDEVISLIPTMPPFFAEVVGDSSFWNSSSYSDGWFTSLCAGITKKSIAGNGDFSCNISLNNSTGAHSFYTDKYIYILINGLNVPSFYQYVDFKDSYIIIDGEADLITPTSRKWCFALIEFDTEGNKVKETTYDDHQKLGQEFWDKNVCLFLKISYQFDSSTQENLIKDYNLTLHFHRSTSDEEKLFAKIADKCPWLESKIIDFSYFLKERIITKAEYTAIWNELTNNLRKINGKLLLYSNLYYQSVKDKTEKIAKLQEKIDMLSAEFNHSVVETFKEKGAIQDITDFNKKYDDILSLYQQQQKTPILDLPTLLTEYINNFDAAEQRFLKNIYEFKNYFYSSIGWKDTVLYQDKIIFDPIQRGDVKGKTYRYLSFSPSQWVALNSSFNDYDKTTGEVFADIFNRDWKTQPDIVTKNNCNNYYLLNTHDVTSFKELDEHSVFSAEEEYYEGLLKTTNKKEREEFTIASLPSNNINSNNQTSSGVWTTTYYNNKGESLAVTKTLINGLGVGFYKFEVPVSEYAPIYVNYGLTTENSDIIPFYFLDSEGRILNRAIENPDDPETKINVLSFHDEGWTTGDSQLVYLNAPKNAHTIVLQVSSDLNATERRWSVCGFLTQIKTELEEKVVAGEKTSITQYYYRLNGFTANALSRLKEKYNKENFYNLEVELSLCSLTDLYNRRIWREKAESNANIYIRKAAKRVSVKKNTDAWPQSSPGWLSGLVPYAFLASFSPEDYDNESLAVFNTTDNSTSISVDTKWDFYKSHFPVGNIYYKGPKIINSGYTISDGGKDYVYNCQFANAVGKTAKDYIEYWTKVHKTTPDEELVEVINPHDSSQWPSQNIQIISNRNETNFFRRIISPATSGDIDSIANMSQNTWATSGTCNRDFFDNAINSFKGFVENDHTIFTPAASSYNTYENFQTPKVTIKFDDEVSQQYLEVGFEEYENSKAPTSSKDTNNFYVKVATSEDESISLYSKLAKLSSEQTGFYENYYGLIAPSYTLLGSWNPKVGDFEYDASWLQPINKSNLINPKEKYRILIYSKGEDIKKEDGTVDKSKWIFPLFQNQNDGVNLFKTIANKKLNCVTDYLLTNNSITIDFSTLADRDESQTTTLSAENALKELGWTLLENEYKTGCKYFDYSGDIGSVYVAKYKELIFVFGLYHEEDYVKEAANIRSYESPTNHTKCWLISDTYSGQVFYDENDLNISTIFQNQVVDGFYVINTNNATYVQNTEAEWDMTTEYFKANNDSTLVKYSRAYTIEQLIKKGSFYYQGQTQYIYESLNPNLTEFEVRLYGHKETYDSEGNLKQHDVVQFLDYDLLQYQTDKNIELEQDVADRKHQITKEYNDELYSGYYYFNGKIKEQIGHLTKGEFYFKYKNSTQDSLIEESAAIAAQLSQYWAVAYNSSKFCSYFLPESWDEHDVTNNHFTTWLYSRDGDKVTIKNTVIPTVEIFSSNQPKYTFYHKDINQKTLATDTLVALKEPYIEVLTSLGGNANDFMLVEGIKGNRYRITSGGLKWKDLAKTTNNSIKVFPEFSGQYAMMFSLLNKLFTNKILIQYNDLLKQKTEFWTRLYTKYPNILLEESFTNEDATTSEDLYTLATYAFKDKSQPESSYQLNYINLDSLKGYCSNELKVGDGILLDHEEFYHEIDEVSQALSQYLFITDISYNLRNDADVSLTINKIKYQDKLIQRLVKLIK